MASPIIIAIIIIIIIIKICEKMFWLWVKSIEPNW